MSKHTPGPWIQQDEFIFGKDCRIAIVAPHPEDPVSDDEWGANAKLIAAAPDLLEALKTTREWLETGMIDDVHFDDLSMLDDIRAAIKKATE